MEASGDNLLRLAVSCIACSAVPEAEGEGAESLRSHDPIDAAGPCLLGLKRQSKLLLHDSCEEAPVPSVAASR